MPPSAPALLKQAQKCEFSSDPDKVRSALKIYWDFTRRKGPAKIVAEGWNGLSTILEQIEDKNSSITFSDCQALGKGITRKNLNSWICLERALQHDPEHADALYSVGYRHYQMKRYEAAVPFFERSFASSRKGYTAFHAAYLLAESLVSIAKKQRGAIRGETLKRAINAYRLAKKVNHGLAAAMEIARKLRRLRL